MYLRLDRSSQAVHKSPVNNVEEQKHEREQNSGTLVDPRGYLLRGHGGPVVFGRLVRVRAVSAVALREVVVALRRDRWQVHGGWETLELRTFYIQYLLSCRVNVWIFQLGKVTCS